MKYFRLSELMWVLAAVSGFALVTMASESYGSMAFEEQRHMWAFGPSRGWPLKCLIRASNGGAELADASVIQGTVYRNVFEARSPLPHLGISWPALIFDLLVALVIVVGPVVFFRIRSRKVQETV